MPAQTTNLFLLEDLEDVGRTSELAQSDLDALHAAADWIKTYVVNEGDCDIQLELPTIPIARAVSVREAWGHQRLEVLPGQRGVAQLVGASLWRIRSPRSAEELRRLPWRVGRD
jgi:hypothetical protein